MAKSFILSQDDRPAPLDAGGLMITVLASKSGAAVPAITSRDNASDMFTVYQRGIDWDSVNRHDLLAVAAKHGQSVL